MDIHYAVICNTLNVTISEYRMKLQGYNYWKTFVAVSFFEVKIPPLE